VADRRWWKVYSALRGERHISINSPLSSSAGPPAAMPRAASSCGPEAGPITDAAFNVRWTGAQAVVGGMAACTGHGTVTRWRCATDVDALDHGQHPTLYTLAHHLPRRKRVHGSDSALIAASSVMRVRNQQAQPISAAFQNHPVALALSSGSSEPASARLMNRTRGGSAPWTGWRARRGNRPASFADSVDPVRIRDDVERQVECAPRRGC